MLTDLALKKLKPKEKSYKLSDRDGMYAVVAPSGLITFRYDYRLNGRRETLTIGRYGPDGIGLSEARDRCTAARKMVAEGRSPALEKQRKKRRLTPAASFKEVGKRWLKEARMAEWEVTGANGDNGVVSAAIFAAAQESERALA